MQKLVPHLWFEKQAKDAAELYVSLFENAKINSVSRIENTPSGDCDLVSFQLAGIRFSAISARAGFKLNPSISLMVHCASVEEVNEKWEVLSKEGTVLMPIGEYPFSKRYGWVQDRFGLSWQLMAVDGELPEQKLTPNLLFSDIACGKAEEAIHEYTSLFQNGELGLVSRYGEGEAKTTEAKINYAAFELEGLSFFAMDHAYPVDFTFNESFSFMIMCENQEEIDYYWEKLSAFPEAEACGWVKDSYGVSWQIVPIQLNALMSQGTKEENQRVREAFMKMKKFDIAELESVRRG